jgi:hypothetical protein
MAAKGTPARDDAGSLSPGMGNRRMQAVIARTTRPGFSVSVPGDRDEVAAEQAAERVMRGERTAAAGLAAPAGDRIQRVSGSVSPRREDAEIREGERPAEQPPEEERLQRKAESGRGAPPAAARRVGERVAARAGQGRPLERTVRAFMESRFGRDFSGTRVHEGAEPARLTNALSARAFTWSSDIYFAPGEYRPQSTEARRVIAHELAHVIQQTAPRTARSTVTAPGWAHQGMAETTSGGVGERRDVPQIARLAAPGSVLAHDVHPWRDQISGTDYEAQTGGGAAVPVWEAYSPWQVRYHYWCHGLSLGTYENFGYSVYSGTPMSQVISDEWQPVSSAAARAGDIAVWTPTFDHSARFTSVATSGGRLDENASRLDTKNGNEPEKNASLTEIRRDYASISKGSPQVFRRR